MLTTATSPAAARRFWPAYLAGGAVLVAVALVAVFWTGGAPLLLGTGGLLALLRGAVRVAGSAPGRGAAGVAVGAGAAAVAVAVLAPGLAGGVLLAAVPVGLLGAALTLLGRGGAARRGGQAALVWWALVTGLLLAAGLGLGWDRATGAATVVTALGVGLVGVFLGVAGVTLRSAAAAPLAPVAPAAPAGCGGCACAAGGCGSRP